MLDAALELVDARKAGLSELGDRGARRLALLADHDDRRVLVLHGKPVSQVLARIPSHGETRGNLAAGGRGVTEPISEQERKIAETVGATLRQRGLLFVGLDIIGGHLTEINVTSPTCVREIDAQTGTTIGKDFFRTLFNE